MDLLHRLSEQFAWLADTMEANPMEGLWVCAATDRPFLFRRHMRDGCSGTLARSQVPIRATELSNNNNRLITGFQLRADLRNKDICDRPSCSLAEPLHSLFVFVQHFCAILVSRKEGPGMPHYHAIDLKAGLSVTDLDATWSRVFDLRMGAEQREDEERIEKIFAAARCLPEYPIRLQAAPDVYLNDGRQERCVLSFLGDGSDLPVFVTECGDGAARCAAVRPCSAPEVGQGPEHIVKGVAVQDANITAHQEPENDESPLNNSSATPEQCGDGNKNANFAYHAIGPPTSPSPISTYERSTVRAAMPHASMEPNEHPLSSSHAYAISSCSRGRADLGEPQALCLTLELGYPAFLPPAKAPGVKRAPGKDLKIEVFLNGELVSCSLVNSRPRNVEGASKAGKGRKKDKDKLNVSGGKRGKRDDEDERRTVMLHGTRIHRQAERPWIYRHASDMRAGNGAASTSKLWDTVRKKLKEEACARGVNRYGDMSPSAEVLLALSRLELPEHLRKQSALAVLDLAITAGKGKKYGPETAYLCVPTHMDLPGYNLHESTDEVGELNPLTANVDDSGILCGMSSHGLGPIRNLDFAVQPPQTSPDMPSMRENRSMTADLLQTPTKKHRTDVKTGMTAVKRPFASGTLEGLKLHGVDLDMRVGVYENARGGKGCSRTLRQRLSDIRQMNLVNRAKHVALLREELDEETLRKIKREAAGRCRATDAEAMMESPTKKARSEVEADFCWAECDALKMLADAALAEDATIDPGMLSKNATPSVGHLQERTLGDEDENMPYYAEAPSLNVAIPRSSRLERIQAAVVNCCAVNVRGSRTAADRQDASKTPECVSRGSIAAMSPPTSNLSLTSPEKSTSTPSKRTRASALANSPCAVPVKSPTKRGRHYAVNTPQEKETRERCDLHFLSVGDPPPSLIDPAITPSPLSIGSPSKSGRGAKRTRSVWNPAEKTLKEALAEAAVKEKDGVDAALGNGCVVGHADQSHGEQRQIGKARGGLFHEDSVVVGMRFLIN